MENSPGKRLWTCHKAHYRRSGGITRLCALLHLITRHNTLQLWKSKCESQLCVHHTKPKHPYGARDHMTESSKRDRSVQLSLSGTKLKIDVYCGDSLSRLLVEDVWYTRRFAGWQYSRDDAFPYFSCQSKPPTLPLKSNHASIPGQGKSFLLISKMSRSALEPTQPPSPTPRGSFLGGKAAGAWSCLISSMSFHGYKWQPICHPFLTCLKSSTMTTSSRTEWQIFTRRREWRNSRNVVRISDNG